MPNVYLNGQMLAAEDATISPMDRGFLFGDGIYEVIPTYAGKPVGLELHLQRMRNGLAEIGIKCEINSGQWKQIISTLVSQDTNDAQGVYIHVSRGTDTKRFHAYPENIAPTVFAYAFAIAPSQAVDIATARSYRVSLGEDLRWKRCHIKSTSLLGNVMHFQQGQDAGMDEIILFNQAQEITEAAACNVFIVKNNVIFTPMLDAQLLPGITRRILLDALAKQGGFDVREQSISVNDLLNADEVWLTSSSKEVGPVVELSGVPVGEGKPGPMWLRAQNAYNAHKFDS